MEAKIVMPEALPWAACEVRGMDLVRHGVVEPGALRFQVISPSPSSLSDSQS